MVWAITFLLDFVTVLMLLKVGSPLWDPPGDPPWGNPRGKPWENHWGKYWRNFSVNIGGYL